MPSMSDERRIASRFSRRLQATAGDVVLHTSNLSASGVQLECPALRLARFRGQLDDDTVDLTLALPDGGRVRARVKVAYVSEYDDEYLIGVQFERFEGAGEATWRSYLDGGTR